jgi:hypothetical protein
VAGIGLAAAAWMLAVGGSRGEVTREPSRRLCPIDARQADAATWRCIAGVGPVLADRLEAGMRGGQVSGAAAVRQIRGVGPQTAAQIQRVTVWNPSR